MKADSVDQPVPSYRRHWCVVLVLAAVLIGWGVVKRQWFQHDPAASSASDLMAPTADWFLLVRCPEMPTERGGAHDGGRQLTEWVEAAREAGFQFLPFTQVMERVQSGAYLPDKTVVLMFDPAYRNTVEELLPTLETLTTPALWVTRSPGRVRADRRYVTGHTRRTVSAHALWDFAVSSTENSFVLEKVSAGSTLPREYAWHDDWGVTGVNTSRDLTRLRRLHANVNWSAQEFVDRLKADVPLRDTRGLAVRVLGDRQWGIVSSSDEAEPFALEARSDRRHASVTWEGTRGINDLRLDLSIGAWFGEVSVLLRWDRERDERIIVGLSERGLRVREEQGGITVNDTRQPWPIQPDDGVQVELALRGETLRIHRATGSDSFEGPVQIQGTHASLTALAVYHRIHGAAVADALQLVAAPLEPEADPSSVEEFVAASQASAEETPAFNGN